MTVADDEGPYTPYGPANSCQTATQAPILAGYRLVNQLENICGRARCHSYLATVLAEVNSPLRFSIAR